MIRAAAIISATVLFCCVCIVASFWAVAEIDLRNYLVRQVQAPNVINLHTEKSIYCDIRGRDFDIREGK